MADSTSEMTRLDNFIRECLWFSHFRHPTRGEHPELDARLDEVKKALEQARRFRAE